MLRPPFNGGRGWGRDNSTAFAATAVATVLFAQLFLSGRFLRWLDRDRNGLGICGLNLVTNFHQVELFWIAQLQLNRALRTFQCHDLLFRIHRNYVGDDGRLRADSTSRTFARLRGDAHDRWLWEGLGRPRTYRYEYAPGSSLAQPRLTGYAPEPMRRFEAEAEWPPFIVTGWAHPDHDPCASGGRGLRLRGAQGGSVAIEIQADEPGEHELRVGWASADGTAPGLAVHLGGREAQLRAETNGGAHCGTSNAGPFRLEPGPTRLVLRAAGPVFLDYIELVSGIDGAPKKR